MQIDLALQALLPYLSNISNPTLWYADESAVDIIDHIQGNDNLTVITNRYDIYQRGLSNNINIIFSDFNPEDYPPLNTVTTILYRVSKEKALVNYLINQAFSLLSNNGKLVITGYKQEGIKSYSDNIQKKMESRGRLIKSGSVYSGEFSLPQKDQQLDDKHYSCIQEVANTTLKNGYFYSKPGVFGWNKVDKGTNLLLQQAHPILSKDKNTSKTLLDLGCGYGWIFLNMEQYQFASITATDNNAAALTCAQKNAQLVATNITITASDCANTINEKFDFILCNPAFHKGFKHNQALTQQFIFACQQKLNASGKALLVLNEFVGISDYLKEANLEETLLIKQAGFKVILLEKIKG